VGPPGNATRDGAAPPSLLVDGAAAPGGAGGRRRRGPTAANVALTTMRPLAIDVNETDASVWVDAAVITADLLQVGGGGGPARGVARGACFASARVSPPPSTPNPQTLAAPSTSPTT
jgi:hypothetical protein